MEIVLHPVSKYQFAYVGLNPGLKKDHLYNFKTSNIIHRVLGNHINYNELY